MHNERHEEILKIVRARRRVTVAELTARLDVSEVTIRKDLDFLQDLGVLVRTRGGATPAADQQRIRSIQQRMGEHQDAKQAIARAARDLIREQDTIYLDSGSTCAELARRLSGINCRVVTNSIDVVLILADEPEIAVHLTGGNFRRDAGSVIGPPAVETIRNYQIHTAFIGTTGFSAEGVFSSQNIIESQLKKAVIATATRAVVLADSSKFGTQAFSVFARAADIDLLITDDNPALRELVERTGIETIFAPVDTA